MKKTILLVTASILIFSLCGASSSYAKVNVKRMEKAIIKEAEKAIPKVEKEIAKWETEERLAPQARKAIKEARQAYQAGDYEEAYALAQKSYNFLKQAQRAEKYIGGVQEYISKWEMAGYPVSQAKKLLLEARHGLQEKDYNKAYTFAMESFASLKMEIKEGSEPEVELYFNPEFDITKYNNIAILKFNNAPQSPSSGEAITNLISDALAKKNYQIVSDKEQADAVITGILVQYGTHEDKLYLHSKASIYIHRKHTYPVAGVQVTISMIDAKTGSPVWQGNGKQELCSGEIESVAQTVVNAILDKIPQRKY